uniref:ARAD1A06138p n=1 Tax=Blastobotrys adeninivorans TaxID=409370 RepID=A0A060SWL9_BLAAD
MKFAAFVVLLWGVGAQSTGTSVAASEVTGCHFHGGTQFCIDSSGKEGSIVPAPTATSDAPTEYTGCHSHGSDTFCLTDSGEEVQFVTEDSESSGSSESSESSSGSGGKNCHFHAGVEHCIDEGESEHSNNTNCQRVDRDYNIPLRIGLLFVIFATSALAVFGPLVARSLFKVPTTGVVFTVVKQFGTGVIISTSFVHLMTHASLMWENDCLGELDYEATGSAITMAGLFLAFMLEYLGCRLFGGHNHDGEVRVKDSENNMETQNITTVNNSGILEPNSHVSVWMMEAGIVFHSILIGITLVVAGDSFFITLFIVILFHQMFEGLALGARIATLQSGILIKGVMGIIFALITPVGMAIGIGVLSKFNGNDPSTIVALGTLDSFSAGVLLWTGLVEMWAFDWIYGYLSNSSWFITTIAFISLLAGMILMSLLGKWA